MKKILIVSIILLVFPVSVNACNTNDKSTLSNIFSNIETSYVFDETTEKFTVKISNLNQNVYFYNTLDGNYVYPSTNEVIIYNVNPEENVRFKFYGNYQSCTKHHISSKYVTLPSYNKYYKDPLCKGKEKYNICQKWSKVTYTYEEFKNKIKSYDIKEKTKEKKETSVLGFYDYIALFYKKYYIIILPTIIISSIIIIYRQNKKNKLF